MSKYNWTYATIGNVTRVRIQSGEDIRHLGELDKKKWTVLSCPTTGLEISEDSLKLMDIDGDGDIAGGDRVLMVGAWLSGEGEDEFLYAADINGDGDIGGADRVFLSNNWLLNVEDDADDLVYLHRRTAGADGRVRRRRV